MDNSADAVDRHFNLCNLNSHLDIYRPTVGVHNFFIPSPLGISNGIALVVQSSSLELFATNHSTKNVCHFLFITAHGLISSNPLSEYTYSLCRICGVCILLVSCISEQIALINLLTDA